MSSLERTDYRGSHILYARDPQSRAGPPRKVRTWSSSHAPLPPSSLRFASSPRGRYAAPPFAAFFASSPACHGVWRLREPKAAVNARGLSSGLLTALRVSYHWFSDAFVYVWPIDVEGAELDRVFRADPRTTASCW